MLLSATPQPLASVYLSQIPYTGLDLGPVGTVLYWLTLILWSAAAAYLVLFGAMPLALRRVKSFGSNVKEVMQTAPEAAPYVPAYHAPIPAPVMAPAVSMTTPPVPAATIQPVAMSIAAPIATMPMRTNLARNGFRSFADEKGTLSIDDIVKGLSRESGMVFDIAPASDAGAGPAISTPVPEAAPAAPSFREEDMIQTPAPQAQAPQAAHVTPTATPKPVAQTATEYSDDIPGFIGALLSGDRDTVFTTVRGVARSGGDVQEFLAQTVCALDDAYRAHVDGTPVHPDISRVTASCHPSFLEKLLGALATAIDSSYSTGITGTKLALTRALAVVNG